MVFALYAFSDDLSMYQVSINSLLYFQRSAPDKLNAAKIGLAFCSSPHGPLYALDKLIIAKIRKGNYCNYL